MNTFNITDQNFVNSSIYQNYLKSNSGTGFLKIRAYAASQALPIKNLKVVVSKIIDNNKVIFFEGNTNDSGIIEKINLPAPKLDQNNLNVPSSTIYDITATYENLTNIYRVNIYDNIYVVQTISIVPTMNVMAGGI